MGSAEMKSDFYRHKFYRDENSGHRWGGKNINHFTFGPGRYYMSTLSLGCFPHLSTTTPPTAMQFSSISDYRLLAVISAQFHFTIWQPRYLCHLDLSGRSISSAGNLHVCISLGPFVRQSVRTVKEEGGCQRPDYFSPLIPECIAHPRGMGFWDILASYEFETRRYKSPSMDV